jgi:hypothetical protein
MGETEVQYFPSCVDSQKRLSCTWVMFACAKVKERRAVLAYSVPLPIYRSDYC